MTDGVVPLEERLGHLLKAAYAGLAQRVDAALAPLQVTARQLAVLSVVATDDSISQIALGERLGVDRTTIVSMIDELEHTGLVERRRDANDRRRNLLTLTDSGRSRVIRAEEARAEAEAEYLSRLTASEARQFVASLRRLAPDRPAV